MTPIDLNNQLRTKAFYLASMVTAFLAFGAFWYAQWIMASFAGVFCLLLCANARLNQRPGDDPAPLWLSNIIIAFLIGVTLASLTYLPEAAEQWSYIVPLISFLIYRIQIAAIITGGYSIAIAVSLIVFYEGPEKVQIFFVYLLSLSMTLAFVYLRELKEQQLKPLRRTDNLTSASTRDYLNQDLDKEIQRSEREGTGMSVLALGLDESTLTHAGPEQRDVLLHSLGRTLHENLRLFDSYYRAEAADFILILPHTNSQEALATSSKLRQKCKQALSDNDHTVTVSIGIAGLNAGDTAETLVTNANKTFNFARLRGANQSAVYTELEMEASA